jgi:hypothetical protein
VRSLQVTRFLPEPSRLAEGLERVPLELGALPREPLLELRVVAQVEPAEELSLVEIHGVREALVHHGTLELDGVDDELVGHPEAIGSLGQQDVSAEALSDVIQPVSKRLSGPTLVGFRPEHGHDPLSLGEAVVGLDRDVRQERDTLWLREDGLYPGAIGTPEVDASQQVQAERSVEHRNGRTATA